MDPVITDDAAAAEDAGAQSHRASLPQPAFTCEPPVCLSSALQGVDCERAAALTQRLSHGWTWAFFFSPRWIRGGRDRGQGGEGDLKFKVMHVSPPYHAVLACICHGPSSVHAQLRRTADTMESVRCVSSRTSSEQTTGRTGEEASLHLQ